MLKSLSSSFVLTGGQHSAWELIFRPGHSTEVFTSQWQSLAAETAVQQITKTGEETKNQTTTEATKQETGMCWHGSASAATLSVPLRQDLLELWKPAASASMPVA